MILGLSSSPPVRWGRFDQKVRANERDWPQKIQLLSPYEIPYVEAHSNTLSKTASIFLNLLQKYWGPIFSITFV